MIIKSFRIVNFKSISDLEIALDPRLSVLTGANNCGKTTVIEAISLWVKCFGLLINKATRSVAGKFDKGEYVFGPTQNRYFTVEDIKSVGSPNFADLFRDCDLKNTIRLVATLQQEGEELRIGFCIKNSTSSRYAIELDDKDNFDYHRFNKLFRSLPDAVSVCFANPVSNILQQELFATRPVIHDKVKTHKSFEVLRNRLYALYHTAQFDSFQRDLSYILFGTSMHCQILLRSASDINRDTRVVITYTVGSDLVEKDLALLGSGTLQTIEILLNLYHNLDDKKDLYLVLLDEPDSHIHRDIQRRLVEVLNRSAHNQIVITTHSEGLIRSTPLTQLFHLDGKGLGHLSSMYNGELAKVSNPHFKGLYPDSLSPLIRSLGDNKGLDFVSAIESDRIIFVEGDDDARLIFKVLNLNVSNRTRKYLFWVLGGIAEIFDKIDSYCQFFSAIKNEQTLWDKAALVFDRDDLLDEHLSFFQEKLQFKYHLPHFCADAYTQESVLLTDVEKLARLLEAYYAIGPHAPLVDALRQHTDALFRNIQSRTFSNENVQRYQGSVLEKLNKNFGAKFKVKDILLKERMENKFKNEPGRLSARKEDVESVINGALAQLGVEKRFALAHDFYPLIALMDESTLFDPWKQLRNTIEI